MQERLLIVDGHNMIFQWPELATLHGRNPAAARAKLIHILDTLRDNSDRHVLVVFDGNGIRANEAGEPGHIQVFYSKAGQSADAIIERLVVKYAQAFEVTVATDDHLEQTTVESFGGLAISSLQLYAEIESAQNALNEQLRRLRKRETGGP